MADFTVAKALAEDLVAKRELQLHEDCCNEDYDAWHAAEIKFEEEVGPKVFLALIAENERLEAINNQMILLECNGGTAQAAINLLDERDQLRAEVSGLRTGYEAYEQVNAELKAECARSTEREILQLAEIEALRKALESCADELSAEVICKHGGQKLEDMHPVTRRLYDRDMASVIDARAALGQGEQS